MESSNENEEDNIKLCEQCRCSLSSENCDDIEDLSEIFCKNCNDLYDMSECYKKIYDNENADYRCNYCNSNERILFKPFENSVDRSSSGVVCRDCYFTNCTSCNKKVSNMMIPNSFPYDLKCKDCWDECKIWHGNCDLCGNFDYLDFNRDHNLERYFLKNGHFERKNGEDTILRCIVCIGELNEVNEDDWSDDEFQDLITNYEVCTCCGCEIGEYESGETIPTCLSNISRERNYRISCTKNQIAENFRNIFSDPKLKGKFDSFEEGLCHTIAEYQVGEKRKSSLNCQDRFEPTTDLNFVRHVTKSPASLPNPHTHDEMIVFHSEAGYHYKEHRDIVCDDCYLYGLFSCLLTCGHFPYARSDWRWFSNSKDKDNVKCLYDKYYDLFSNIILNRYYFIDFYLPKYIITKVGDKYEIILPSKANLIVDENKKNGSNTDFHRYLIRKDNTIGFAKFKYEIDLSLI